MGAREGNATAFGGVSPSVGEKKLIRWSRSVEAREARFFDKDPLLASCRVFSSAAKFLHTQLHLIILHYYVCITAELQHKFYG